MSLSWLGFGPSVNLDIKITDEESRKHVDMPGEGGKISRVPVYSGDADPVLAGISAVVSAGKKIEHLGIKVDLIGRIELFYDRGNHYEFLAQSKELAPAGVLTGSTEWEVAFEGAEKPYESYNGVNARLRYFLRVSISRSLGRDVTLERDLWVFVYPEPPTVNNSIKMEVGIEDVLHIEFEYAKSKFHLKDVVIGKVYFLLVRLPIKSMEVGLIKRESCGSGPNMYNESDTLTKFEIMDGDPVRGESIPARLFLAGFDLTPTMRNVANKFSVKYYLNLVLQDVSSRRYFKQQEITIYRRAPSSHSGALKANNQLAAYAGKREAAAEKQRQAQEAATKESVRKQREEKEKRAAAAAEKAKKEREEAKAAGHAVSDDESDEEDDDDDSSSGSYETDSEEASSSEEEEEEEEVVEAPLQDDSKQSSKGKKNPKGKGAISPKAAAPAPDLNEYGEDIDGL